MPEKENNIEINNISEIAKYNLDNKTNFYTIDQVRQHQKDLQELANLQADYDAHTEDWKVNPDSYSNLDALKYSGSRPETLEDLYRLKGWKQDAKTTTLAGLGALASLPLASEFATYGALGGAARVGGGFLGSHLGSKGLGAAGNYADSKLGTNFLGTTGNVLGGFLGFGLGRNGIARYRIQRGFEPGKYFPRTSFKDQIAQGSESTVYDNGKTVLKVMDQGISPKTKDELLLLNKDFVSKRNKVHFQLKLKIKGYTDSEVPNKFYPVYEQTKITPIGDENYPQIQWEQILNGELATMFKRKDWQQKGSTFINSDNTLRVGDLSAWNVGRDRFNRLRIFDGDVYKQGGRLPKWSKTQKANP